MIKGGWLCGVSLYERRAYFTQFGRIADVNNHASIKNYQSIAASICLQSTDKGYCTGTRLNAALGGLAWPQFHKSNPQDWMEHLVAQLGHSFINPNPKTGLYAAS